MFDFVLTSIKSVSMGGGEGVYHYQLPFIVVMCAGVSGSTLDEM